MFYALHTNFEWVKENVNLFVALAPIASMKNAESLDTLSDVLDIVWKVCNYAGIFELFKTSIVQGMVDHLTSPLLSWTGSIEDLVDMVSDSKYANINSAKVSLNKFPNETSLKSLVGLGLLKKHDNFVGMGDTKPCFFYCTPPKVLSLSEVSLPIGLFNGA